MPRPRHQSCDAMRPEGRWRVGVPVMRRGAYEVWRSFSGRSSLEVVVVVRTNNYYITTQHQSTQSKQSTRTRVLECYIISVCRHQHVCASGSNAPSCPQKIRERDLRLKRPIDRGRPMRARYALGLALLHLMRCALRMAAPGAVTLPAGRIPGSYGGRLDRRSLWGRLLLG